MGFTNLITNFKTHFKPKQSNKIRIGLDWGFSSLKVVVLEAKQGQAYLLKDARIIQCSSEGPDLGSLVKELDFSGGINLGICGPDVVIRYVEMAKMGEEEFKASLRYEAASHLPFPVDDLNLDGVILKDLADNKMLVMLAAARKNFIDQQLRLFQETKIKVNILDIDSLALINAFSYTHPGDGILSGAVALLNIGATVTNINILEDGIPCFSRDINFGGRDFADKLSHETMITNFVTELRKSFDYYEAGSTTIIHTIFLSGGGSLVFGLQNNLENLLAISIERWNPCANFEFAAGLDKGDIEKTSSQLAVAVGLALR
ncbi:MAG: pilus assembly protein PilM [Candidatus Omnitrophota bacterium]